jgi:aryl-alcohol dehydrogenase-like predicted oxidoreductase
VRRPCIGSSFRADAGAPTLTRRHDTHTDAASERITTLNPWWEFWPRQTATQELEESLERMGFDRLDLLYSSTLPDELPVPVAVEQVVGATAPRQLDEAIAAVALAERLADHELDELRSLAERESEPTDR